MRKLKGNQAVASIREMKSAIIAPNPRGSYMFHFTDRLSINAISARAWAGWASGLPALITGKVAAKLSISIEATGRYCKYKDNQDNNQKSEEDVAEKNLLPCAKDFHLLPDI